MFDNIFLDFFFPVLFFWMVTEFVANHLWSVTLTEARLMKVRERAVKKASKTPAPMVGMVMALFLVIISGGPSTLGLSSLLDRPLWSVFGGIGLVALGVGVYRIGLLFFWWVPGKRRFLSLVVSYTILKWGPVLVVLLSWFLWFALKLVQGAVTAAGALKAFGELVSTLF